MLLPATLWLFALSLVCKYHTMAVLLTQDKWQLQLHQYITEWANRNLPERLLNFLVWYALSFTLHKRSHHIDTLMLRTGHVLFSVSTITVSGISCHHSPHSLGASSLFISCTVHFVKRDDVGEGTYSILFRRGH